MAVSCASSPNRAPVRSLFYVIDPNIFENVIMLFRILQLLIFTSISQPGVLFPHLDKFRPFFAIAIVCMVVWYLNRSSLNLEKEKTSSRIRFFLLLFAFCEVFPPIICTGLNLFITNFMIWIKIVIIFVLTYEIVENEDQIKTILLTCMFAIAIHSGMASNNYFWTPEKMQEGRLGSYGMYRGANDFGLLMTLSFPITLKLSEFYRNYVIKIFLFSLFGLCIFNVFLTGSRGSLIGTTIVVLLSVMTRTNISPFLRKLMAVCLVFGIITAGGAMISSLRSGVSIGGGDDSAEARKDAWAASGRMFIANPQGIGFDQTKEYMKDYGMYSSIYPHNTYVKVAAESGVMGFIGFVGMLYITINRLMRLEFYYRKIMPDKKVAVIQALLFSLVGFLVNTSFSQKEYEWLLYIIVACSIKIIKNESKVLEKQWILAEN